MTDQIRELERTCQLYLTDGDGTHTVYFEDETTEYALRVLDDEDITASLLQGVADKADDFVRKGTPLTVQMDLLSRAVCEIADYMRENSLDVEEALEKYARKPHEARERASYTLSGQRPPEPERFYRARKIA